MFKIVELQTINGNSTALSSEAVEEFASSLRGRLIRPNSPKYDEARAVWNGMVDKYPALIAKVADVADVIRAVNFARENKLLVSVRGSGHNVAGSAIAENGLVIDLTELKGIHVDPFTRTVKAQAGVTIGELDFETQAFGMAVPMGVVTATGIAGLTLSGGVGWMRRKHGMTLDNLISVDIVTADGKLIRASQEENAELFWGVRGGGGNFGIVTSFEYAMHPVGPDVFMSALFHDGANARRILRFFREWAKTAPDEISLIAVLGRFAENETFPADYHGKQFVAFIGPYIGDPVEGERLLEPLRKLAEPVVDFSGVMPYVAAQQFFDEDYPSGEMRYYWKSSYINNLGDNEIDRLISAAEDAPSDHSTIDIWHLGGAISRVIPDATAFRTRYAPYMIGVEANYEHESEDAANIEWTRRLVDDMQQFSDGSQYFNFPGFYEEGLDAVRSSYGDNYERLVALKNQYDPDNLFRLNQNIKPTV